MSISEHEAKVLSDFETYETELAALSARVAELERELDGMRRRARAAEAQRDEAVSCAHESLTESVRAQADAARLREALEDAIDASEQWVVDADANNPRSVSSLAAYRAAMDASAAAQYERAKAWRAALASAPSAEPTPREMRVAEAVREAYDRAIIVHGRLAAGAIDLAAVVAKAVGT